MAGNGILIVNVQIERRVCVRILIRDNGVLCSGTLRAAMIQIP
mgnify:CR=1 FL=1|jgi:hypothetical protein